MPKKKPKPIDRTEELADAIALVKFVAWSLCQADPSKLERMKQAVQATRSDDCSLYVLVAAKMVGPLVEHAIAYRKLESTDAS